MRERRRKSPSSLCSCQHSNETDFILRSAASSPFRNSRPTTHAFSPLRTAARSRSEAGVVEQSRIQKLARDPVLFPAQPVISQPSEVTSLSRSNSTLDRLPDVSAKSTIRASFRASSGNDTRKGLNGEIPELTRGSCLRPGNGPSRSRRSPGRRPDSCRQKAQGANPSTN
jgi:hypothetical protein